MPKADIGNGEIHYEIHGDGPPLLMVAGLGGTGDYWNPQIEAFAKHYTVIVHDHRGTGQSSRSEIDYSIDQMADDLLRLMDHLKIEQAHIVGHSTGGAMALLLSDQHPERLAGSVVYAGWTKADPHLHRCFDIRRSLLRESGAQAYAHATPLFLFPSWFIRDNGDAMSAQEPTIAASFPPASIIESRMNAVLAFDCSEYLNRIAVPTLVICADDDFLTPVHCSRELAAQIPGAELNILETGAHAASVACPDQFNEKVLAFLARQKAPQGQN
jgi:aminoacrylate hydrolase